MTDYYLDASDIKDQPESYFRIETLRLEIRRLADTPLSQKSAIRNSKSAIEPDAVQLATSLATSETLKSRSLALPVFIASDNDLLAAAKSENLPIDNPLDHTDLDSPSKPSQS